MQATSGEHEPPHSAGKQVARAIQTSRDDGDGSDGVDYDDEDNCTASECSQCSQCSECIGNANRANLGGSSREQRVERQQQQQVRKMQAIQQRRRSMSLDALLNASFVHEMPATGERIIVSRGPAHLRRRSFRRKCRVHTRRRSATSATFGATSAVAGRLDEGQKRTLLLEFLRRSSTATGAMMSAAPLAAPTTNPTTLNSLEQSQQLKQKQKQSKGSSAGRRLSTKPIVVQYDLAALSGDAILGMSRNVPIALGDRNTYAANETSARPS